MPIEIVHLPKMMIVHSYIRFNLIDGNHYFWWAYNDTQPGLSFRSYNSMCNILQLLGAITVIVLESFFLDTLLTMDELATRAPSSPSYKPA